MSVIVIKKPTSKTVKSSTTTQPIFTSATKHARKPSDGIAPLGPATTVIKPTPSKSIEKDIPVIKPVVSKEKDKVSETDVSSQGNGGNSGSNSQTASTTSVPAKPIG